MLAQLKLQHKNGGMKSYDQDSMIGLSLQNAQSRYGTTLTQHDQEYTAEYWEETAEAATEAGKDVEDMLTTAEITNQIGQATLMIRNGTWYGSVLTDISHGSENKTWGMVKEETEETKLGKILDSAGKFILGFQIVTSISQGWTIYQVEKDKYGQGTALSDGAKVAVSGSVSAAAGYITSFLIEAPFVNVLGGVVIQERVDKGINQLWDGVTKGDWD